MKTILVPSDYSVNANHAFKYAIEINKKLNGKIVLFHSVLIPLYSTDVPIAAVSDEGLREEASTNLKRIKADALKKNPGMDISIKVTSGFVGEEIIFEEKDSKADYVVMGTRGASGLREFFIGSNTASVIEQSTCPVIAVPENAGVTPPKKIVFATNYGEDDFENIFSVIDFARLFDSEVYMLHIAEGKLDKTYEFAEIEGFAKRIQDQSKYPKVQFKLLENKDVYEGLNNYLDEIKADMVAISMRERTFKFFSRSLTKKMAYHAHIPLMAFQTHN